MTILILFDQWWQRDIESMVLRDRNHPSIFCWSIGNEVIERKKLEVVTTARKLADYVHKFDPSRSGNFCFELLGIMTGKYMIHWLPYMK